MSNFRKRIPEMVTGALVAAIICGGAPLSSDSDAASIDWAPVVASLTPGQSITEIPEPGTGKPACYTFQSSFPYSMVPDAYRIDVTDEHGDWYRIRIDKHSGWRGWESSQIKPGCDHVPMG